MPLDTAMAMPHRIVLATGILQAMKMGILIPIPMEIIVILAVPIPSAIVAALAMTHLLAVKMNMGVFTPITAETAMVGMVDALIAAPVIMIVVLTMVMEAVSMIPAVAAVIHHQ
jgi:hypothetical protein